MDEEKEKMKIITCYLPIRIIKEIDDKLAQTIYTSRSEFIRQSVIEQTKRELGFAQYLKEKAAEVPIPDPNIFVDNNNKAWNYGRSS